MLRAPWLAVAALLCAVSCCLLPAGAAAAEAAPTAVALPACENALPPGEGFGGTVTITQDCLWRPQLHFVTSLIGQQRDFSGPLEAPFIFYNPAGPVSSQSGPPRLALSNVVLANFSLSSPGLNGAPVLWPKGMLLPGLQPGSTTLRRLYLTDVKVVVSAQTLQEYLRFFHNSSHAVYTDNATFLHLPYWSDPQTAAISVGLLLAADAGAGPRALAGAQPAPGRNFVLAADQSTLPTVLQAAASVRTPLPFLLYLSANVTLTPATLRVRTLPVNRPLILVGKSTALTGVDLGMEVNTLQLGQQGSLLFDQLVLENLAPGDVRSLALAGPYEALMGYNLWAVAFDRGAATAPRLQLVNCTLVVSPSALDKYLFQATLFRVRPGGFEKQLEQMTRYISKWDVQWVEADDSIFTSEFASTAMAWSSINMTASAVIAPALLLPDRRTLAPAAAQHVLAEYNLTHIGVGVRHTMRLEHHLASANGPSINGSRRARELIMLTTNVTFKAGASAQTAPAQAPNGALDTQLLHYLANNVGQQATQQHTLMGIVTPPVTLDLAYSQDLVQLPAAMPPGGLALVNVVMLHLAQGPKAASPDATVLLPDVWTHLMWGLRRSAKNVVWLSNVTLFVTAAEFSFIRSHTTENPTSFTINLQGDANMRFYDVHDLRADGLFIQRYAGPGLEAQSLLLRVEPGWSMNGQPPRGFWATSVLADVPTDEPTNKLSDAMVVVLAASLVTAVVGTCLACLAFLFWRKRSAENQRRTAAAAVEEGKASAGGSGSNNNNPSSGGGGGHTSSSGLGALGDGRKPATGIFPGLLRDSMPVHDSSDSYNVPEVVDRAALTAELARSQLGGPGRSGYRGAQADGSSGSDSSGGDAFDTRRQGGGRQVPPAAAGGVSTNSMASDACLQRLQSAISVMSQDVLSRRLQYAVGSDGSPVVTGLAGGAAGAGGGGGGGAGAAAAGGLGRPSPMGLHQQHFRQQQQQALAADRGGVLDADGLQQQHSGSLPGPLARGSSGSLGGNSIHNNGSPRAPEQQQQQLQLRDGSGDGVLEADGHLLQLQQGGAYAGSARATAAAAGWAAGAGATAAAAAAAAGKPLSKSSLGSSAGSRVGSSGGMEQLKLLQLVGQGTFGQVYKALWRRRCVAVKVLQLPATAGSSDVPWKGMGRASSHREKMAVMETVVSTTMSHPNIVQVYTYVLQPLMQGSMPRSRKQLSSSTPPNAAAKKRQPQQQELELNPEQLQLPQPPQQQQLQEIEPQQQPPPSSKVQGAAAQLLARFGSMAGQHKQQQPPPPPSSKQPPDPQSQGVGHASAAAEADQQQQQQLSNGSLCQSRGSAVSDRGDSSQSLARPVRSNSQELSRLTPAMAKAAAAALPAAAAAAAAAAAHGGGGHGSDGGASQAGSTSSDDDDGDSQDDVSMPPHGPVLVGWELRLVMEFCDAGSLRTALDHKLLIDRTTGLPALECVLFLAHDVACAMIHLHSEHLLHGDLKASNVLLKRTAPRLPQHQQQQGLDGAQPAAGAAAAVGGDRGAARRGSGQRSSSGSGSQAGSLIGQGLGLMAKVADFGLSLTLGPTDTHVSQMHMGTLTHMAPELLLHGRASKASDVYAFGILLWELATGRRPYSGTPVGMLAHKVVQQGWRPAWPGGCSLPVKMLVEGCWTQDPADRPSFEQVVQQLEEMANHLDDLKAQQAQAMAAAAAPLLLGGSGAGGAGGCGPGNSSNPNNNDADASDPGGHELTPSMMAELMPSGFGASAGVSDIEEEGQGSGQVLYEMSQLSGGSGGIGRCGLYYQDMLLPDDGGGDDDDPFAAAAAAAAAAERAEQQQAAAAAPAAATAAAGLGAAAAAGGPVMCNANANANGAMLDASRSHSSGSQRGGARVAVVQ